MKPSDWGHYLWASFHLVINGYPQFPSPQDKEKYRMFVHGMADTLPCKNCSISFREILRQNPMTDDVMGSRDRLILWGIYIHNLVNKKLGKKILTVPQAIESINKLPTLRCVENTDNHGDTASIMPLVVASVIIIIVAYMAWKN